MILGHIDYPETYPTLLQHPIWNQALDWIHNMDKEQIEGIYKLRGEDMYVNVHSYQTLPRHNCRYENHRKYVDLQYCIAGGELIDWSLANQLKISKNYHPANDVEFYEHSSNSSVLHLTPGTFAIFFPSDAHMPKIADGVNSQTKKLVVKIAKKLL